MALRKLERREEAMEAAEMCLSLDPTYGLGWRAKGAILRDWGRHAEGLACYDEGLKFTPEDPLLWTNRARALTSLGRLTEVIPCYEAALRIWPKNALPLDWAATQNDLGNWWRVLTAGNRTHNLRQAIACYDAALSVPQTFTITSSGGGGGTSATFVRVDTTTQGNWRGTYGANGYNIAAETPSYSSFVQVLSSPAPAETWVWDSAPSDSRAPQRPSGIGRIASCWYTVSSFVHDLNFIDGLSHQVALYVLDWDASSRIERIDVLDAATGAVLDTRTVSGFTGGQYFVWTVRGHVIVRVSWISAVNAVGSGLFFD